MVNYMRTKRRSAVSNRVAVWFIAAISFCVCALTVSIVILSWGRKDKNFIDDVLQEMKSKTDQGSDPKYHTVFSTDCGRFQKWQSYLLFYSAFKVKQQGTITRIASGCTLDEVEAEKEFHADIAQHMSSNFKVHFTPDFSVVKDKNGEDTGDRYVYFNKPFGLLHWMEHGDDDIKEDDIIILVDSDQVLTRPITNDFSEKMEHLLVGDNPKRIVTHGSPFAQLFGIGDKWLHLDLNKVTGTNNSPAKNVNSEDAMLYYPAGPPYLATARDMHKIAQTWSDFVPRSYVEHPDLMAEMYAFCIAAAHLNLPHQIVKSLMVSDIYSGDGAEGWKLIDEIDNENICSANVMVDHTLPSVLHYCQSYRLGEENVFAKRKIPVDIFSCEAPLLEMPPPDVAQLHDYYISAEGVKEEVSSREAKQLAFMICSLTRITNEAAMFHQKKNCDSAKDVRFAMNLWSKKRVMLEAEMK